MTPPRMRLVSYGAIAVNACTAFAMSAYLLLYGWAGVILLAGPVTLAAYGLGYRFARTGRTLPRIPYMIALAVYVGIFALPPMARLQSALFAYALARTLMFRAVWLTDRREAYLHLLVYFAVVATAFGHWRADWSLAPFLFAYLLSLMVALVLLHQDGRELSPQPRFPWATTLAGLPLALLLGMLLFAQTPLLPTPHLALIPDQPRPGQSGDEAGGERVPGDDTGGRGGQDQDGGGALGRLQRLLAYMSEQPMQANPQGGLMGPVSGALRELPRQLQQLQQGAQMAAVLLARALLQWWWLLLLALLLLALWRRRHRLWLGAQVLWLDPWRLRRLARQPSPRADSPHLVYAAFERLWAWHGLPRARSQAPLEHLGAIAADYQVLARLSQQVVGFFQDWRYGGREPGGLAEAIRQQERIRMALDALARQRRQRQ